MYNCGFFFWIVNPNATFFIHLLFEFDFCPNLTLSESSDLKKLVSNINFFFEFWYCLIYSIRIQIESEFLLELDDRLGSNSTIYTSTLWNFFFTIYMFLFVLNCNRMWRDNQVLRWITVNIFFIICSFQVNYYIFTPLSSWQMIMILHFTTWELIIRASACG